MTFSPLSEKVLISVNNKMSRRFNLKFHLLGEINANDKFQSANRNWQIGRNETYEM